MADHRTKLVDRCDYSSVAPILSCQASARPTTLPIQGPYFPHGLAITPGDYSKLFLSTPELDSQARGYSTPEVINALAGSIAYDEQTSPGTKIIEEMINVHSANNRSPLMSSTHSFMNNNVLEMNRISSYQREMPMGNALRNRSTSSSMQDHDSSSSTTTSSPHQQTDELQYVPSEYSNVSNADDFKRREKKRERNRQAAQKCRTRKLTRIAELQKRVDELQGKNKNLNGLAESLKTDVLRLEKQLEDHRAQGCALVSDGFIS